MKIKFWKAAMNSIVILGGVSWASNDNENAVINITFAIIGVIMMGAGVKWMIEDIEYGI